MGTRAPVEVGDRVLVRFDNKSELLGQTYLAAVHGDVATIGWFALPLIDHSRAVPLRNVYKAPPFKKGPRTYDPA